MLPKTFITTKQAAELCGVKPGTIRQWVKRGRIEISFSVGRTNVYHVDQFDKFLKEEEEEPCSVTTQEA